MPRRGWLIRIKDIIEAAKKIVSHTTALAFEQFIQDDWMVDAVLHNLAVIGEAAQNIPDEVAEKFPDIPWADVRDMRNIVVHQYFGVDLSIVWQTIREDIPPLISQLEAILKKKEP